MPSRVRTGTLHGTLHVCLPHSLDEVLISTIYAKNIAGTTFTSFITYLSQCNICTLIYSVTDRVLTNNFIPALSIGLSHLLKRSFSFLSMVTDVQCRFAALSLTRSLNKYTSYTFTAFFVKFFRFGTVFSNVSEPQ